MMFLRDYQKPVSVLKGVGPVLVGKLARLDIHSIKDLICHYPRDYQDRRHRDYLEQALNKDCVNVIARIRSKKWTGRGYRKILKVIIEDNSGNAALVCFGRSYLNRLLIPGQLFRVYGSFRYYRGEVQSSNFDIEKLQDKSERFGKILPIYPLTEGFKQETVRRLMRQALCMVSSDLSDEIPEKLQKKMELTGKLHSLNEIHFPGSFDLLNKAHKSLVYEELLYYQLILINLRKQRQGFKKKRVKPPGVYQKNLLDRLPFCLTKDQEKVLAEIEEDLFNPHPCARLIQGDVGSGKTLIALLSALWVIESGEQAALLAPTELLARQHALTAARLLEPLGVRVSFLSGQIPYTRRKSLCSALKQGKIDILIGTHALFSNDIEYRKLGLVIVDEQHRFGVRQRGAIIAKGDHPDLLLLTATPIPRTLAIALYRDLDLSEIRSKPEGRKGVITHMARQGNEYKVYERVRREILKGGQAYFVYPLIEESKELNLKNAETMHRMLKQDVFPDFKTGLIHSRLPEDTKQKVMEDFTAGKIDILVATSVMEVGLDVSRANCIVIEHAERFGLSNLHQLRGRVGRGTSQSYAFLIYSKDLTDAGIKRLKVMMSTNDGFKISEEDLKIRGPGEFLGYRQSGFLKLGLADLIKDKELFIAARRDAEELLQYDPGLINPENRLYRKVLEGHQFLYQQQSSS